MLAYSLLRLGSESSALNRIRSKATLLQNDLKQSLREADYNPISWAIVNRDQGVENLMNGVDHLLINMRSYESQNNTRQIPSELGDSKGPVGRQGTFHLPSIHTQEICR